MWPADCGAHLCNATGVVAHSRSRYATEPLALEQGHVVPLNSPKDGTGGETMSALSWTLIVPVRRADTAKSRLTDGTPELARAIAVDTIVAASRASGVAAVIVVTDDPELERVLAPLIGPGDAELRVLQQGSVQGLNPSIRLGIRAAEHDGRALAVMLGDLPALRPAELDSALAAASAFPRAVVADHLGTGTTLLTALPSATALLDPAFGADSFARHLRAGHTALELGADSTVRSDVDTRADLERAERLGLGHHTSSALAARAYAATLPGRNRVTERDAV